MGDGLTTTFELLAKTGNEAAVPALIAALDSRQPAIQEGALRALLRRRSPAGGRELLRRLYSLPPEWREIIRENHGRMTGPLRDALLGNDPQMFDNACRAVVWFREYDLTPTLLNLLEDPRLQNTDTSGEALLKLIDALYEELAGPRDYSLRRDPQLVRQHVVTSLEGSVERFARHKRREALEAFLCLVSHDNTTLRKILRDPHHVAFLPAIEILSNSERVGVMRLLLNLLETERMPTAALSVVSKRTDPPFVERLLRSIGKELSREMTGNLKRIESVAWFGSERAVLEDLDGETQGAAVRMAMATGASRLQTFALVRYVLTEGKTDGRRAAAEALVEFNGAAANNVALRALTDPDPTVQATVAGQLRHRGIPGSLRRLIDLIDSPHEEVRNAARENLKEFSFNRILQAFDMLDEGVRANTAKLVAKIDPRTIPRLKEELHSRGRVRRLRALGLAKALGVGTEIEPIVIELLQDEDHMVRMEAAGTLARCTSQASREALKFALHDRSIAVREVAAESLAKQANPEEEPQESTDGLAFEVI